MSAKRKPLETVPVTVPAERRISWDAPFVPAKSSGGTIVQDLPPAEAATRLVQWLRDQKLI
jgi:hypothetical protein